MSIIDLKNQFEKIRNSEDFSDQDDFCEKLSECNNNECLEYHYYLMNSEVQMIDELHQMLCSAFIDHGEVGEDFLLKKIKQEKDPLIKARVLQMLGGYKYSKGKYIKETAALARQWLNDEADILRDRAIIVLGWVGDAPDISLIEQRLKQEKNNVIRQWAATALMWLYDNNQVKPEKNRLLQILKSALEREEDPSALNGVLVAIQEITDQKLGISSTSHKIPSKSKLNSAKKKAIELLK